MMSFDSIACYDEDGMPGYVSFEAPSIADAITYLADRGWKPIDTRN